MASIPEEQELNNSIELDMPVAHYWCHACQKQGTYDPHDLDMAQLTCKIKLPYFKVKPADLTSAKK